MVKLGHRPQTGAIRHFVDAPFAKMGPQEFRNVRSWDIFQYVLGIALILSVGFG